jgi:hypothetical protein
MKRVMWMSVGKTKARTAKQSADAPSAVEALVAFIDLLGFSERVLAVRSIDELGRLVDSIRGVRDHFDYQPSDPMTRETQRLSKTEVLAFSDCVVVSIGLKSPVTEAQGEFDTWGSDLLIMAHVQAVSVVSGHFLRGGWTRVYGIMTLQAFLLVRL